MDKIKIKDSVRITKKKGINHLLDDNNKLIKNKPWLGDLFSFLYDWIMKKSVFPKKFNASIEEHYAILKKIFLVLSVSVISSALGWCCINTFLPNFSKMFSFSLRLFSGGER